MRNLIIVSLFLAGITGSALAQEAKPDAAGLKKAAEAAFQAKKWTEAEKALAELVKLAPEDGEIWLRYGYALHAQGKLDEALKAHEQTAEHGKGQVKAIGVYNIACVYALKKEKDRAFEYLEKAVAAGFGNSSQLEEDADLDNVRGDPRFKKVLEAAAAAGERSGGQEVMLFNQSSDRMSSRAAMFSNTGGKGEIHLSWGPVEWKEEYEKAVAGDKMTGKRWRLGADFWTTLDTNLPMTFGQTTVAVGYYYLTVEKKASGEFVLNVLDPVEVRKALMDAFQAGATKGGLEVPLKHQTTEKAAEKLTMSVTIDDADKTKGEIAIHFGTHRLTGTFTTTAPKK